jgi:tRNA-dihydrouridine synthase
MPLLRRHIELAREHLPVQKMLFRIKNHLARYLTGLPGASRMRQQIMAGKDIDELSLLLDSLT